MSPASSIFWHSNRIISEIGRLGESKAADLDIQSISPSDGNSIDSSKLDLAPLAARPRRRPMASDEHMFGRKDDIEKRDGDDIEPEQGEEESADFTGPEIPSGTADPSLYAWGRSVDSSPLYTDSNLAAMASPTATVFAETSAAIPPGGELSDHVEHLALYISVGVAAFIAIATAFACLMRRWRRHRNDGFTASGARRLLRYRLRRQGFVNLDSEKAQLHHMDGSQTAERPPWDPEATFAKPLTMPPKALRRASNAFSKFQHWGSRSLRRADAPRVPRKGCHCAPPSIAKVVGTETTLQEIQQAAPKSPTNSSISSISLGPAQPAISRNPPTIPNFSWCTPHSSSTDVSSPKRGE